MDPLLIVLKLGARPSQK